MIKLITLDLDNTLWEAEAAIFAAHRAMCHWLRENVSGSASLLEDRAWRDMRVKIAKERADIAHHPSLMRKEMTRALLAPLNLAPASLQDIIDASFNVFHEGRNQVVPYPEAVELLEYLKPRVPVIAITNGNSDLERIGLAHLFTDIVSAETAGVAKPHPGIFEKALRLAGNVPAQHALHVGDHIEEDIEAARKLGFKTIWVNAGRVETPAHSLPDRVVHSAAELKKVVAEMV